MVCWPLVFLWQAAAIKTYDNCRNCSITAGLMTFAGCEITAAIADLVSTPVLK